MEGLAAGKHNRGRVYPKGSQNCQLGGQAGPVGQEDLGGWVDSLASLQVGLEAQEGSEGASTEVLEVGHLMGLGVDHLLGPKGGYPEVQMVHSYHLGWHEVGSAWKSWPK